MTKTLTAMDIKAVGFANGVNETSVRMAIEEARALGRVSIIMIETPSNPLNTLVDIALMRKVADEIGAAQGTTPVVVCDNTLLGPLFQKPLIHGADVSVYSLTKYVGGHSDLIAGAALGSKAVMKPVRALRSAIGTQLDAFPCWMIARSLETLSLRMTGATRNGQFVADFLQSHPAVVRVDHLSFLTEGSPERNVYEAQCDAPGSTLAFHVRGGETEAFRVLNALKVIKLAVSLGGTESLICHPASTTHSGVPKEVRDRIGVTDATIRLSVGIEHPDDLIADLTQALATIEG